MEKQDNERKDINVQNASQEGDNLSNEPFRGIHIKISATDASHGMMATEGVTYFEIYGVLNVLLSKLKNDLGITE